MSQNIPQNYLSPLEFQFVIHRLPYTEFFTQSINVPGLTIQPVEVNTPFRPTHFGGDTIDIADLTIEMRLDENMKSFLEIRKWLYGISFPSKFEEFAELKLSDDGIYSDATLMILTNGKAPNIQIVYKDIFPISLSDIPMNTTSQDVEPITVSVTFKTNGYDIRTIE